jgi:hypothetical protein
MSDVVFSKHKDHLPSIFFLISLSYHAPANNHAIPLLSFPVQHSIHYILPQLKFMSRYSANELFSYIFPTTVSNVRVLAVYLFLLNYNPGASYTTTLVQNIIQLDGKLNLFSAKAKIGNTINRFLNHRHRNVTNV